MPNWSAEQQAIFTWFKSGKGNLVVRARAGTGKTTTIIEGINYAPEAKILLAAFNKSIASELEHKLKNPRAEAKTLHSLGFSFLRRAWTDVRIDNKGDRAKDLSRLAAPNAPDPILSLISKIHTKAREVNPFASNVKEMEEIAVRFELFPEPEWEQNKWDLKAACFAALRAIRFAAERTSLIDFSDMIFLPLIHNLVRPWFNMVIVDEAQDMTVAQLMLATGACKKGGRVCVVGDNRQAIYAFRGADSDSLDRLKEELKAKELGLTTTYRCPKKVVALAQAIVPDYQAAPSAPEGEIKDESWEGMIEKAKEGDFILSRTNAPLAKACMALLKKGVRARIKGRDLGQGLLNRIRQFKMNTLKELPGKLSEWQAQEGERMASLDREVAAKRMEFITDQCDLFENLAEGLASVTELEGRIRELFVDDAENKAVMCSTTHRAKGLETERVFLLAETFRSGKIEEDNIKYVAITRAKALLVWVSNPK